MNFEKINFEDLEYIEKGEYGKILKYDENVCIKIISDSYSHKYDGFKEIYTELSQTECCKHENLISINDVCMFNEKLIISMEYFESFDLNSCCCSLEWENVKVMLKSIVNALLQLKKYNLIHRDIKTENILVNERNSSKWDENTIFKLCDYDFIANVDNSSGCDIFGTLGITPPEFWFLGEKKLRNMQKLNFSIDIWSLGMLIIDLCLDWNFPNVTFEKNIQYYQFINDFTDYEFMIETLDIPDDKNIDYKNKIENHVNYETLDKELLSNLLTEPEKRWSLEQIFEYLN